MRHRFHLLCLLAGLLSVVASAAAADDKPAQEDKKPAKKEKQEAKKASPAEKPAIAAVLTGRLLRVEAAQKYLTVQVAIPIVEPAVQTRAIGGRTFPTLGYRVRRVTRDVELQVPDDMRVRTLVLPQDFDEKGRPRRYSRKELQELRGPDANLPGYTADFDSLKPDQIIKVYLARKKDTAKPAVHEKAHAKKDQDIDKEAAPAEKPQIAMIVILGEIKK